MLICKICRLFCWHILANLVPYKETWSIKVGFSRKLENLLIVWIRSDEKKKWMKDFQWNVVFLALKTDAVKFYTSIIFNFLHTYFSKTFYRWRSGCRWWNNWPLNSILTVSNLYQAFIGLGVFLSLGSLYGLGSWFASQKPSSLLDVKTTQEGFLEVSKILGKVFVGF